MNPLKDRDLLDLFTNMTRIHTAYVERRLQGLGLHNGQAAIITALGQRGPSNQKELAHFRQVSAATISVMLGRMERDGLIVRSVSEDGKCNLISLTEDGRRSYEALSAFMVGESDFVFAGLSAEEKRAAEQIFHKIAHNLAQ